MVDSIPPDSGRITIGDVARHAGVAISSASAALNNRPGVSDATRLRVRRVARQLGFVASPHARSLSSKRAYAIGLVIHRPAEVLEADPFFGAYVAGVERAAAARGNALVLQIAEDEEEETRRYRELAASRMVDGVLLNETTDPDRRVQLIQQLGLTAVGVNAGAEFPFPAVHQDSRRGVTEIVNHLVDLGHRHIGHVTGAPAYVHAHEREAAWRSALAVAGLSPGPVFPGHFTFDAGYRAAEMWMELDHRPTAVFCSADLSAIGFILRLQDAGGASAARRLGRRVRRHHHGHHRSPCIDHVQRNSAATGRSDGNSACRCHRTAERGDLRYRSPCWASANPRFDRATVWSVRSAWADADPRQPFRFRGRLCWVIGHPPTGVMLCGTR